MNFHQQQNNFAMTQDHQVQQQQRLQARPNTTTDLQSISLTSCVYCGQQFRDEASFLKHHKIHEDTWVLASDQQSLIHSAGNCFQNFVLPDESEQGHNQEAQDQSQMSQATFAPTTIPLTTSETKKEIFGDSKGKGRGKGRSTLKRLPEICTECFSSFPTLAELQSHSQVVHKIEHKKFCTKGFDEAEELTKHRDCNSTEKTFKCDTCGSRYSTKKTLQRHQERTHKAAPKKFGCQSCSKSFHDKSELARHEKHHENSKTCSKCNKKMYKGVKHVCRKKGQVVTNFPCEICGAFLGSKPEWSCHMWVHTKDPKYIPTEVPDDVLSSDDEEAKTEPKPGPSSDKSGPKAVSPPKAHAVNSYSQLNQPLCLQTSRFVKENEEKPLDMQVVQANKTATASA